MSLVYRNGAVDGLCNDNHSVLTFASSALLGKTGGVECLVLGTVSVASTKFDDRSIRR